MQDTDQYADGGAARLWKLYIGDQTERLRHYREFLTGEMRRHGCKTVLDTACGTGIDSVLLIEEGYRVTSCDLSEKMLKDAWHTRWARRKEPGFDDWDIYEADWLTLPRDIGTDQQYDAVICMGNSFSHLPDLTGNQDSHRQALRNFADMVRPGGILVVDHRNFDYILDHGRAPSKTIYYNSRYVSSIHTSVVYQDGAPVQVVLDYTMQDPGEGDGVDTNGRAAILDDPKDNQFTLSYYPHRVNAFRDLLQEAFNHRASITTLGDFKPLEEVPDPAFFVHVVYKPVGGLERDEGEDGDDDDVGNGGSKGGNDGDRSGGDGDGDGDGSGDGGNGDGDGGSGGDDGSNIGRGGQQDCGKGCDGDGSGAGSGNSGDSGDGSGGDGADGRRGDDHGKTESSMGSLAESFSELQV